MAGSRSLSKVLRLIAVLALPLLLILQFVNKSQAQDVTATVSIDPSNVSRIRVKGKNSDSYKPPNPESFYFLQSFAGVDDLGKRVSSVVLYDRAENVLAAKQLIPGEYVASEAYQSWQYSFEASPLNEASAAAHTSWIDGSRGVLFLDDLLPQFGAGRNRPVIYLKLEIPSTWQVITNETPAGPKNTFRVTDAETAVFLLAQSDSVRQARLSTPEVYMSGEWQVSDQEAARVAAEIFNHYEKLFGPPGGNPKVYLLHFPKPVDPDRWEADTRGSSTVIVSSEMPFRSQSLQRLHEQLRHEIFHLWIPNGLALTGNYDWFYEGFALYLALKQGVSVNRLRFDDFLDTLARAYTIENAQGSGLSLVQATNDRWRGANTRLYARGMLVAFLCDIAMLERSKGKSGVEKIIREIFEKYGRANEPRDGNEAILGVMAGSKELSPVIERYIKGSDKIDWQKELVASGIVSSEENYVTRLKAVEKPRGRQKEILDALGYNNWRKLAPISK
jgi:predicted metalloprotease with PDZ domain